MLTFIVTTRSQTLAFITTHCYTHVPAVTSCNHQLKVVSRTQQKTETHMEDLRKRCVEKHVHEYFSNAQKKRKREETQSNTTQHKTWDNLFQRKNCTQVGLEPTPHAFWCDALPTELLRQLSWQFELMHLYKPRQSKARQSEHLNLIKGEFKLSMKEKDEVIKPPTLY